ncbi:septum formation initiator family protein [Candidatus Dependentiae bacterium]|nr:septum formation initiator family protein [Candidatus Dependentiae bacterium]
MTLFIRKILKYGLLLEIALFFVFYYFGPNGMVVFYRLAEGKKEIESDIMVIIQENERLKSLIEQGKTPFAKEKIARERLLMKKNNEIVYFLK